MTHNPDRVTRACVFPAYTYDFTDVEEKELNRLATSHKVELKGGLCQYGEPWLPFWRLQMSGSPQDVDSVEEWICNGFLSKIVSLLKYGVRLPVDSQTFYSQHQQSGPVKDIVSQTNTTARKDPEESISLAGHFPDCMHRV